MAEGNGRNGNGRPSTLGVVKAIAGQLPPSFILLILINTGFLYFMMDFMEKQMDTRMQLAMKIIDHCVGKNP